MAEQSGFTPYQAAINKLVAKGPEYTRPMMDILVERRKELEAEWVKQLDANFDAENIHQRHRATREFNKLLRDMLKATEAFLAQPEDTEDSDDGAEPTA